MNILIAPDKFKGSLSAHEVCDAIEQGVNKFDNNSIIYKHPLADGGEGSLQILSQYTSLKTISLKVHNPLFKQINANYKVSIDTAYIELASSSGLTLLKPFEQNCFYTSTYGTGELIKDAIYKGFKKIILFIGGSATNDAGIGMANALGYSFLDKQKNELKPIGKQLCNINEIKISSFQKHLNDIDFKVICDVDNPFYGPNGAALTYAKQKGANDKEIILLDEGLKNINFQFKKYLNKNIATENGAGAAGGFGGGAMAFLNAEKISGIDFMLSKTIFQEKLNKNIDLVITGEGSVDAQTLKGKVVSGVIKAAQKENIPSSILAGIIKDKALIKQNLNPIAMNAIMQLNISEEEAMKNAFVNLKMLAYQQIKFIKKTNF
ncbi:MAG: glycerate kinase [Lutibacter sp.]